MALLIYATVTLLLTLLALQKRSKGCQLLLQFVPFTFLFLFLWWTRENYSVLQVRKLGYQFKKSTTDYLHPARAVTLGGSQQRDDLFYGELAPNSVQLIPSLADSTVLVKIETSGVVLLKNGTPLNAVELQDGDRISYGGQQITFFAKGAFQRGFLADGKKWEWPRKSWRTDKLRGSVLAGSLDARLYSLSDIGESLGTVLNSKAAVTLQRLRLSGSRRPLVLNRVLLLGGGKNLTRKGKPIPTDFSLNDGDILQIYSIEKKDEFSRLSEITAYTVRNSETLNLYLKSPQTVGMKEGLLKNGSKLNKPLLLTTSSLPYSAFPTVHYSKESLKFGGLSAFIQTESAESLESLQNKIKQSLLRYFSLQPNSFQVVTEQGNYRLSYGEEFSLGQGDRILFSLSQIQFPWRLLQALLILFLLKILFQPPIFPLLDSFPAQLILLNLDFFLTTRFLFAFRASTLYPYSSESLELALTAILLVPYMIFSVALCARKTWDRTHLYNFSAYTVLALLITGMLLPGHLWLVTTVAALFICIAIARYWSRSPLPALLRSSERLSHLSVDTLLLCFFLFVVVVQWSGAGEAVRIAGLRLPLSVIYHPFFLAFSCYYLYRLKRLLENGKEVFTFRQTWLLLIKLAMVILAFFALSYWMSDFGFFLLLCLPVLFILCGFSVLCLSQYELKWKATGVLLMATMGIFPLVFSSFSTINKVLPLSYLDSPVLQRILLAVDPSSLEDTGILSAERQLGHQRTFVAYAHSGIVGAGYMSRPVSSALGGTALNDNVPSAFLLNDFGAMGFLATLLALFSLLWLWRKAADGARMGYAQLLSLAAVITLAYADVYMLLANCGIVLFTGKNVFFWGLNSISDLFHGALLIVFILLPLNQRLTSSFPSPISFVAGKAPEGAQANA